MQRLIFFFSEGQYFSLTYCIVNKLYFKSRMENKSSLTSREKSPNLLFMKTLHAYQLTSKGAREILKKKKKSARLVRNTSSTIKYTHL